jgi:hypothetical protein
VTSMFSPARNLLQGDRNLHFARQIRIVVFVRVADTFVRHELDVYAAEGVRTTRFARSSSLSRVQAHPGGSNGQITLSAVYSKMSLSMIIRLPSGI